MIEVKDYILELLKSGLWVFPVKGKGQTVEECKRPMSFREGDDLITWKDERILSYAEDYARRGHTGWAVWLYRSNLLGLDLDLYKLTVNVDIVDELKRTNLYIERTGRGGLHVIGFYYSTTPVSLSIDPPVSGLEWKHDGYFIIHPSVLRTPTSEYRYERIHGDLLNPGDISDYFSFVGRLLGTRVEVVPVKEKKMKAVEGRFNGLRLNVDDLSNEEISVLLYLVFKESGCTGMQKILEEIMRSGICPISKGMDASMRIPRTTRWMLQYSLASVMAWIGFSAQRAREWMKSWRFVDEDVEPRGDSLDNALMNVYRYGKLFLIPRGGCPFCTEACPYTPIHRVLRIPEKRIKVMAEAIKAARRP
ncbi:MAG: hypothetical protein QXM08_06345 [Thermofilaceae archaeon]